MASSFSRQRNPNMEKALFDWPIVLQYDVKEISRKFFGHEVCLPARSLSQPKPRCVCIRFIYQSNRSISVRLLFLFCSRVFISRSYENRSNSETVGHEDLRFGQIVYILVFYNISFSWLLSLDGFKCNLLCRVYCVTVKTNNNLQ